MTCTPFRRTGIALRTCLIILVLTGLACWGHAETQAAEGGFAAKVNGSVITEKDVEAEIDRALPRVSYHGSVSKEAREELRGQALERLIDRELQYQEARAQGLKPDPTVLKQRMGGIRDQFPSKKEYQKALEQAGLNEKQLRAQVEKDVLVNELIEKTVTVPSRVSREELTEYYKQNTSKFIQPESVRVRILSTQEEKKAREALSLIAGGEAFGSVAGKMSEDNFRIKGGDIGYIHRGRLLPELEQVAFKLRVGEVSGVIKAESKWFVLKVEESMPARQLAFDDVQEKLRKDLESKRAGEIMSAWMAGLRSKAKMELPGKKE